MKMERNGDFTCRSAEFGQRHWAQTDAEGRLNFKVPVLEGTGDTISFYFVRGGYLSNNHPGGRTSRSGSWFRHSQVNDRFRMFRPDASGQPFDLGVMEVER